MVLALERPEELPGRIVPGKDLDQLRSLEDAFGGPRSTPDMFGFVDSGTTATPATFADVVEANVAAAKYTGLLTSRSHAEEDAVDRRIAEIEAATGQRLDNYMRSPRIGRERLSLHGFARAVGQVGQLGWIDQIPEDERQRMLAFEKDTGSWSWQAYLRQKFEGQIKTLAEQRPDMVRALRPGTSILEDARQLSAAAEERLGDVNARSGWGGFLGGALVGGLKGSMYDPTFVPSMAVGGVWGLSKNLVKSAVINGAINAGASAVQQPWVQSWREEAGLGHGFAQAAHEVAGAAAAGAALDFAGRSVWRGARFGIAKAQGVEGLSVRSNILDGRPVDDAFGMLTAETQAAARADAQKDLGAMRDADAASRDATAPETPANPEAQPASRDASRDAEARAKLDAAIEKLPEDHPARRALTGDDTELATQARALGLDRDPVVRGAIAEIEADAGIKADVLKAKTQFGLDDGEVGLLHQHLARTIRAAEDGEPAPPVPDKLMFALREGGGENGYVAQAMRNLLASSRTASGVVDVSASASKAGQMAEGLTAENAATAARRNFETVVRRLYAERDTIARLSGPQLVEKADEIALDINAGILKKGALHRLDDSPKYPYTKAAELPHALRQFGDELHARLSDAGADPVETAAWIEWRANLTDHFWADGVGKTSKALAAVPLMRAGLPLPEYRSTKEFFAAANKRRYSPENGPESYLSGEWSDFLAYYRTLMPAAVGAPYHLKHREAVARATMETEAWRRATVPDQSRDTQRQPGYGSPGWLAARRYTTPAGDVVGYESAVKFLLDDAAAKAPGGLQSDRKAFLLLGLPGAGKSTVAARIRERYGAAHLVGDDAKAIIPEYDKGQNSGGVHEEASDLMKDVTGRAVAAGHNIIIEKLGSSDASIMKILGGLASAGYTATVVHVDVPKALAMERAIGWWRRMGRAVPLSEFDKTALNLPRLMAKLSSEDRVHEIARLAFNERADRWEAIEAGVEIEGLWPRTGAPVGQPGMGAVDRGPLASRGHAGRGPATAEGHPQQVAIPSAPVRLAPVQFAEAAGKDAAAQVERLAKKLGLARGQATDGAAQPRAQGSPSREGAVGGAVATEPSKIRAFVEALKGRELQPHETEPSPFGEGFQKVAPELEAALQAALGDRKKILPRGVEVEAVASAFADAVYSHARGLIGIAASALEPAARLGHEAVHALKAYGHISASEWGILRAGAKDWLRSEMADQYRAAYRGRPDLDALLEEEAVAHLYEARVRDGADLGPRLNGLIDRLREVIERIGNALKGQGFQSLEDVLARIDSGEMGARGGNAEVAPGVRARPWGATRPQDVGLPAGLPTLRGLQLFAIRAFHGTPHDFERFSSEHIGKGEGAQAFGHGLYFAENEGVARGYQKSVSSQSHRPIAKFATEAEARAAAGDGGSAGNSADGWWAARKDNSWVRAHGDGHTYEVRISAEPEQFLDWDKPLSQQSEMVRAALPPDIGHMTGREAYHELEGYLRQNMPRTMADVSSWTKHDTTQSESKSLASQAMHERGVPGIRYLDQGSRGKGEGSYNYVVFDDSLIEITAKNGEPLMPEWRRQLVAALKSADEQPVPGSPEASRAELDAGTRTHELRDLVEVCKG